MSLKIDPTFVGYYHRELNYLKNAGKTFSEKHPKIASRLGLTEGEVQDPHVERMIESFAFLTARLQKQIDSDFPELAQQLLGALYPQLTAPIPSMSVARFEPDHKKIKATKGQLISKGTQLEIRSTDDIPCYFRTSWDMRLWPIEIESIKTVNLSALNIKHHQLQRKSAIHLRLKRKGPTFNKLHLEELCFYMQGDNKTLSKLYDALFHERHPVITASDIQKEAYINADVTFEAKGFQKDEGALPYPNNAHPAYRLLMEYSVFPKKFHFFSVRNLHTVKAEEFLDIYIPLSEESAGLKIGKENILLNCVPIVNLFHKNLEPLKLDYKQPEYRLVADRRYEKYTEIYQIGKVTSISEDFPEPQTITPYFSYTYNDESSDYFWYTTRKPSEFYDTVTSEVYLSLVDLKFNPLKERPKTIYASALCTNGNLAESVPAGAALKSSITFPVKGIKCIESPSKTVPPVFNAESYWQLISHLNLNHLSLKETGIKGLKNILNLYAKGQRSKEFDAIVNINYEPTTRRALTDAWRGFIRGTLINLTVEGDVFVNSSLTLFGNVLRHFFALYSGINTFTELSIIKNKEKAPWKQWHPASGYLQLL